MDFLGLKNLTILRKTVENIEKTRNLKLKLSEIPLDNQKAYELMTKAEYNGSLSVRIDWNTEFNA